MSRVSRVLHVRLKTWRTHGNDGVNAFECDEFDVQGYPGLILLFERDRLDRIAVDNPEFEMSQRLGSRVWANVRTAQGLHLGSREAEVRRALGHALTVATRPYLEEPTHELTWIDRQTKRGIVFETDEVGTIVQMRAGGRSISNMEGCL